MVQFNFGKYLPTILFIGQLISVVAIGGYTYATMSAAVAQNTDNIQSMKERNLTTHIDLKTDIRSNSKDNNEQSESLVRVETGISYIQKTLDTLARDLKAQ